jgi:hypothetical protein
LRNCQRKIGTKAAKFFSFEGCGLDPPPAATESIQYQWCALQDYGIFNIGRPE